MKDCLSHDRLSVALQVPGREEHPLIIVDKHKVARVAVLSEVRSAVLVLSPVFHLLTFLTSCSGVGTKPEGLLGRFCAAFPESFHALRSCQ